jgi:hypothetical protein
MYKQGKKAIAMLLLVVCTITCIVSEKNGNQKNVVEAASNTKTVNGLEISAKVTAASLRVRTKASITAEQLTYKGENVTIKKNKKITITKQKLVKGVVWYYVTFKYEKENLQGYVHSDYVALTFANPVKGTINSRTKVNVRNTPGVSDDYLMYNKTKIKIADGKNVTVKKEANANGKKWFKVSFTYKEDTLSGYVLANQVSFKAEKKVVATPSPKPSATPSVAPSTKPISGVVSTPDVSTSGAVTIKAGKVTAELLNVRQLPGMDQERTQINGKTVQLKKGTQVYIFGSLTNDEVNWYYVVFQYENVMLSGYVMAQYIQ